MTSETEIPSREELAEMFLAHKDDLGPEAFPALRGISSGFMYQFTPEPESPKPPEYVYVPMNRPETAGRLDLWAAITNWNMAWEAADLRHEIESLEMPPGLEWVDDHYEKNIYLLPLTSRHHYPAYAPLYHLIPRRTLERFGLPLLERGNWPTYSPMGMIDRILPSDFDDRFSRAFASHLWPLLHPGSRLDAFSSEDPIRVLAHNLDYWLPYAYQVVENRLRALGRVPVENDEQARRIREAQSRMPEGVRIARPYYGGYAWMGEDEALEATRQMVEIADGRGRLRAVLDAIRSGHVQEDFSSRWSHARADFERKLNHNRSKTKVVFIEIPDTVPVQGPESEVHESLLWEDFLALLDVKERRIVVLLRNGVTAVGEISRILGYANHSPVSKALARIRQRAVAFLEA